VNSSRIKALALTGVAAALCFGLNGPARAHVAPSAGEPAAEHTFALPSLSQVQGYLDAVITHRVERLDAFAAKVAADPRLTAEQKSAFAARIAQVRQHLVDLMAAIDAATTTAQVHELLEKGSAALFFPAAPRHLRLHHRDPDRGRSERAEAVPATEFTEHHRISFDPGCHHRFGAGDADAWRWWGTRTEGSFGGFRHHR
jgi:hypothetical protein